MFSFEGRKALVTGGGRGIGRAIALALAQQGADVAIAARGRDELEHVAGEIRAHGRKASVHVVDMGDTRKAVEMVDAAAKALGGLDKLLETLRQRLAEQRGRHQGGKKWIGTAGTSPFGAYGYNPEGIRIGQDKNRNFRAVKVWDRRDFKDLADDVELGTRNIKIALRRLRKFARTGAPGSCFARSTSNGGSTGWPAMSRTTRTRGSE